MDIANCKSADRARPDLSLVVPLYNERDNIEPLIQSIEQALADYPGRWELLLVDDGSSDGSDRVLAAAAGRAGPHVRVISLLRNYGQTAAMQAGLDAARGEVIATLDGDLQNDPADIPAMVDRLIDEDLDLVAGWRRDRKDAWLKRTLPSWLANQLIARTTGIRLHDYGCSLKVFRASVLRHLRLYGQMHRFIPAWLATVTTPERIAEHVVRHHPRKHGQSKYGLMRTFAVCLDLVFVHFFLRYRTRPGHFFGGIGLALGTAGGLILAWLAGLKLLLGADIGTRPLLLLGFVLVIAGVQMISSGLIAELLARTYYESSGLRAYLARPEPERAGVWKQPAQGLETPS